MIQKHQSFAAVTAVACFLIACSSGVWGQANRAPVSEDVFVVNYLANKKFKIQFLAKAAFQAATGSGEIELNDKGIATIKADFKSLKSVFVIGGRYSTYVIWAVLADGSAQNLGEIEHNARPLESDGKFKTEVSLSGSFGLLVSAEPHGKVTVPSTLALVAGTPTENKGNLTILKKVQLFLSDTDHSGSRATLKKKDEERYRQQNPIVFGAEYAIEMANEAGALTYATAEINAAISSNEKLKAIVNSGNALQIEQAARGTIELAADAEKQAIARKRRAREAQMEAGTTTRISSLESDLSKANDEITRLRAELGKVTGERDLARDAFQEKRVQSDRLEILNGRLTFELDKEKQDVLVLRTRVKLLEADVNRLKGPKEYAADRPDLEELLRNFGKVQPLLGSLGLQLTLADTFWMNPDSEAIANEKVAEIEMLARQIGSRRYLTVDVVSYVTDNEDIVAGQTFAEKRAKSLEACLGKSGIPVDRLRSRGIATYQPPLSKNSKRIQQNLNRIEILLKVPE
ncbi:MAG: hypothetical protein ABL999_20885 [Pyrinomonadaceae bacterium]